MKTKVGELARRYLFVLLCFDFCFRLLYSSAINAYAIVVCYSRKPSNGARLKKLPDRAKCWRYSLALSQPTMLLSTAAHLRDDSLIDKAR